MSEELDRLDSLLAQATPGPWDVVIDPDGPPRVYRGRSGGFCVSDRADHLRADADAGLIVGLRNAAPALLAAAREAEELREWQRKAAAELRATAQGFTANRALVRALLARVKP